MRAVTGDFEPIIFLVYILKKEKENDFRCSLNKKIFNWQYYHTVYWEKGNPRISLKLENKIMSSWVKYYFEWQELYNE